MAQYINPIIPGERRYPTITPFTYRDGLTYLKTLELLLKAMKELIDKVNDNSEELTDLVVDILNEKIEEINTALSDQETSVDTKIEALETWVNSEVAQINDYVNGEVTDLRNYVNTKVDEILNASVEIQDPIVAQMVNDTNSDTRTALDQLYPDRDDVEASITDLENTVNTTMVQMGDDIDTLEQTSNAHGSSIDALETLTTTGRLSEAELDQRYFQSIIDLDKHSIVDNGTTPVQDDIQAIIDSAEPYATITSTSGGSYKINAPLTLTKPVQLEEINFNANNDGSTISIESDDVRIKNVNITGRGTAAGVIHDQRFITSTGASGNQILNTVIDGCHLKGCQGSHMWLDWMKNFVIKDNIIENGHYAGVMMISPRDGFIHNNIVKNLVQGGELVNSYGITVTDTGNTRADRAENIVIDSNIIDGVLNWEGIDTHGGKNIQVVNNTIKNCRTPIAITTGNVNRVTPPEQCIVANNYVERGNAGTETAGIVFNGKSGGSLPDRYCSGTIGHNVIKGFTKDLILDYFVKEEMTVAPQTFDGSQRRSPSQHPYRVWCANTTVVTTSGSGVRELVFPSGFFSAPPIVQITKATPTGAKLVAYTTNISKDRVDIGLYDPTGGVGNADVLVAVTAIQTGSTGNGIPGA